MRCPAAVLLGVLCLVPACGQGGREVVVYTALDEMYSRPILDRFAQRTGIEVRPVYDTEAAKTTGLVNRLIAERQRPRADVFWSNEVAQTILLKRQDALEPYQSPNAAAIPAAFKDADGAWTGFAARARVIIYNTDLVKEPPTSILDLADAKWANRAAIAKPLFGTTVTHAAALFACWGDEKAKAFFTAIKANGVAVLSGNATVRDRVAAGDYAVGLTDTDDANGAVEDGLPAKWLLPDQGPDGGGTLVLPNTVALVRGAPHAAEAKALIDYLLSAEVEEQLAQARSMQIPLHPDVQAPAKVPRVDSIKAMPVDFAAVADRLPATMEWVKTEFLP